MKKNIAIASLLIGTMGLSACASIIDGSSQRLNVATVQGGSANCRLQNERGTWNVYTPGSTEVKRSKTDLHLNCTDASGQRVDKIIESDMNGWFLGNILLGGIIGGVWDASTGAMWKYPHDLQMNMPQPVAAPAQDAVDGVPIPAASAPAFNYAPAPTKNQ